MRSSEAVTAEANAPTDKAAEAMAKVWRVLVAWAFFAESLVFAGMDGLARVGPALQGACCEGSENSTWKCARSPAASSTVRVDERPSAMRNESSCAPMVTRKGAAR